MAVGVVYALGLFDWGFVSGRGPYWSYLREWDLDRAQALIGWRYFVRDAWRLPLFWVPELGYPEGTNIVFTDSIPLAALAAKAVHTVTGVELNGLGLWMELCFVGQAGAAAILLAALGVRGRRENVCGVLIVLSASILLERFGHGALCGHFLVLLALASYFRLVEAARGPRVWTLQVLAPAVCLLVSSYLAVMVAAIAFAATLEAWRRRLLSTRACVFVCAGLPLAVIATMVVAGMVGAHAPSPVGGGYGRFSMNVLAPFFGRETSWTQKLFGPVAIDATGGQYEGFNYLGVGVLALGLVSAVTAPALVIGSLRRHLVLVAVLAGLAVYALGDTVFCGGQMLLRIPSPALLAGVTGAFRSSGRFFWPAYYAVVCGLVACVAARFPGRVGIGILAVLALAQYAESAPLRGAVKEAASRVNPAFFASADVVAYATQADRLFVYPSYECTTEDSEWPRPESWRAAIVELTLALSEHAVPTNSVYVNRGHKDCTEERRALARRPFTPGTLYVVRRRDAPDFIGEFGRAGSCLTTATAFVCLAGLGR